MNMKWTPSARKSLRDIQSIHFTEEETKEYRIRLVRSIQDKILSLMVSMPAREPSWQGTYRILVDRYKVYYSFSDDRQTCFIEALRHQHQND
ncbi:type II toxin-antitoxin system RelE/ParE family toxin [Paenibacillus antri]|uniref:Type II toxin-antitoxin system RelE/ParE family toxin n=1 Tax=Paenibacillus antri TaxID=2582848 RepID=A0A5R9GEB9_9BACL|nr:type II toxin-antitoxin system RelE/ParE family toxin [Paenibacillus antri]